MPKTAFEVEVGGNTSGEQGTDFFYAVVSENGARREQINFTPRLVLAERSVYELGTAKTTYMEVYENGKLRRRRHYGERKTDGGTQSFVERTEEFK
jgi:hypothetical protein